MKAKPMKTNRIRPTVFLIGIASALLLSSAAQAEECFTKQIQGLTLSNCVDGQPIALAPGHGKPPSGLMANQPFAEKPASSNAAGAAGDNANKLVPVGQPPAFAAPDAQRIYGPEQLRTNRQVQVTELPAKAGAK